MLAMFDMLTFDTLTFFITFLVVCLILLILFAISSKRSKQRVIGFFVEKTGMPQPCPPEPMKQFHTEKEPINPPPAKPRKSSAVKKPHRSQDKQDIAILQQKIDERRRIVDSNGHSTLYDEYFELVFETKKGETLRLVTTRAPYKEIPFNQEGTLTHRKGVLVNFQYQGILVSDEHSPLLVQD